MTPVRAILLLVTLVGASVCASRVGHVDVTPVPPSFLVALWIGACLGACPSSAVAVGRDGVVAWDGYSDVGYGLEPRAPLGKVTVRVRGATR